MPTILQFHSLTDLACYAKKVNHKGYQINVQNLTLQCKLGEADIAHAEQHYQAWKLASGRPVQPTTLAA